MYYIHRVTTLSKDNLLLSTQYFDMKKLIYVLLGVVLMTACETKQKAVVKGTLKNFGNGEIYFVKSGDEKNIDTVKVNNDAFEYSTELTEPTVYMVNFGPEQQPGFLILENGNTSLSYEMGNMTSLEVKGGKEQDVYNRFLSECRPIFQQMDSIGNVAMAHEEDAELLAKLQQYFYTLDEQLKGKQLSFIQNNKQHYATAFIAVNYLNEKMDKNVTDVDNLYNLFDEKIKSSYYGTKLREMANQMKGTSPGQPAPDFTLNDPSGKPVSLSSFKGKITLLDFWASWCGPCRGENPNVVAAYQKYHNKGFDILAVSLDEEKEAWLKAIEKDRLTWTHVSDLKGWASSAAALYGIQSIPANYLLDKEGKIIAKDLRGEALEAKLAELFK
jgi:peroxiredoxin